MSNKELTTKIKSSRDLELDEDFNIFKNLEVTNVNGKLMLGSEENLPFSVEHVMEEHEFVRVWLRQFALGNSIGINYFNLRGWNGISAMGQKSVMVVDNDMKPVLVIPPLLSTNLTEPARRMLQRANVAIYNIANTPSNKGIMSATSGAASQVANALDNIKRLTYTDLVPDWYYEKHNVNPSIEQQVHYIKDVINAGTDVRESLNEAKDILIKLGKGESITIKESEFLKNITRGEFDIPNSKDPAKATSRVEEDNDPLSC